MLRRTAPITDSDLNDRDMVDSKSETFMQPRYRINPEEHDRQVTSQDYAPTQPEVLEELAETKDEKQTQEAWEEEQLHRILRVRKTIALDERIPMCGTPIGKENTLRDVLLQAIRTSEQDSTIPGDDPEVHLEHPTHHHLSWISCIHPLCETHIQEKVVNKFFPTRLGTHPIDRPYYQI